MDTIDLDIIIKKMEDQREDYDLSDNFMKACIKEGIHQVLVLAGKKAKVIVTDPDSNWMQNYTDYMSVDKQSILDIEKLIV